MFCEHASSPPRPLSRLAIVLRGSLRSHLRMRGGRSGKRAASGSLVFSLCATRRPPVRRSCPDPRNRGSRRDGLGSGPGSRMRMSSRAPLRGRPGADACPRYPVRTEFPAQAMVLRIREVLGAWIKNLSLPMKTMSWQRAAAILSPPRVRGHRQSPSASSGRRQSRARRWPAPPARRGRGRANRA